MKHSNWARRNALLLTAIALAFSACSATETVTINDDAVASATSTAIRENASVAPGEASPGEDPVVASTPQPSDTAVDTVDDESATDSGDGRTAIRGGASGSSGCTFTFVDSFGDIQIELAFTSQLQETSDASAEYEVFDGNGNSIGSNTKFFEELMPGEQVRIDVDTLLDEPTEAGARSGISCEVRDIEPSPFFSDGNSPVPGDSCRFVEIDSFDDIQLELTVTNPFADSSDFNVDYVLRGSNDIRFGDGIAFIEAAPGESVTVSEDSLTEFPEWVNESTFSCEIVNIDGF